MEARHKLSQIQIIITRQLCKYRSQILAYECDKTRSVMSLTDKRLINASETALDINIQLWNKDLKGAHIFKPPKWTFLFLQIISTICVKILRRKEKKFAVEQMLVLENILSSLLKLSHINISGHLQRRHAWSSLPVKVDWLSAKKVCGILHH